MKNLSSEFARHALDKVVRRPCGRFTSV